MTDERFEMQGNLNPSYLLRQWRLGRIHELFATNRINGYEYAKLMLQEGFANTALEPIGEAAPKETESLALNRGK